MAYNMESSLKKFELTVDIVYIFCFLKPMHIVVKFREFFKCLKQNICSQTLYFYPNCFLLRDKARPHIARVTKRYFPYQTLYRPPFSPNILSVDQHLLNFVKEQKEEKYFQPMKKQTCLCNWFHLACKFFQIFIIIKMNVEAC